MSGPGAVLQVALQGPAWAIAAGLMHLTTLAAGQIRRRGDRLLPAALLLTTNLCDVCVGFAEWFSLVKIPGDMQVGGHHAQGPTKPGSQ